MLVMTNLDVSARPFRWNVARREQLGRLVEGQPARTYREFRTDVRSIAAKVVSRAPGEVLVFVGRSVESVFDYLSGLLGDGPPELRLLQYSAPWVSAVDLHRQHPVQFAALRAHFAAHRLDPASIVADGAIVRFVDIVSRGWTFQQIFGLLKLGCELDGVDWNAVRRRIRFMGLTAEGKTSPKTWRWHQHQAWLKELPRSSVVNVSVPYRYWYTVANSEEKSTPSYDIWRWGREDIGSPLHGEAYLMGLRLAVRMYDRGRSEAERVAFARELAALPEMKAPENRALVSRLRKGPK